MTEWNDTCPVCFSRKMATGNKYCSTKCYKKAHPEDKSVGSWTEEKQNTLPTIVKVEDEPGDRDQINWA